LDEVGS
jgi:hypothetical protein